MRKFFPVMVMIVFIGLVLTILAGNFHTNNAGRQPPSASTTSPPETGNGQATKSGSTAENDAGSNVDPKGPIAAAKADAEALETALFMPRSQADRVVEAVVLPSQAETQKLTVQFKGSAMATDELHYHNWSDARKTSGYSYTAQKFHLDRILGKNAQITLFGVMAWYPPGHKASDPQYCWPDLRTVYMRYARVHVNGKTNKRWLLVTQEQASADKFPPPPKSGITVSCDQAIQKFQSKLTNFKDL
jgi:hypothetical protein